MRYRTGAQITANIRPGHGCHPISVIKRIRCDFQALSNMCLKSLLYFWNWKHIKKLRHMDKHLLTFALVLTLSLSLSAFTLSHFLFSFSLFFPTSIFFSSEVNEVLGPRGACCPVQSFGGRRETSANPSSHYVSSLFCGPQSSGRGVI